MPVILQGDSETKGPYVGEGGGNTAAYGGVCPAVRTRRFAGSSTDHSDLFTIFVTGDSRYFMKILEESSVYECCKEHLLSAIRFSCSC